jgi:hypothetical protein
MTFDRRGITHDPGVDADITVVCDAIRFMRDKGATLGLLEAINGVSYQPGSRFGHALDVARQRGLVELRVEGRYHLAADYA